MSVAGSNVVLRLISLLKLLFFCVFFLNKWDVQYWSERDQYDWSRIDEHSENCNGHIFVSSSQKHTFTVRLFSSSSTGMFALRLKNSLPATQLYVTKIQWPSLTKIVPHSLHFLQLESVQRHQWTGGTLFKLLSSCCLRLLFLLPTIPGCEKPILILLSMPTLKLNYHFKKTTTKNRCRRCRVNNMSKKANLSSRLLNHSTTTHTDKVFRSPLFFYWGGGGEIFVSNKHCRLPNTDFVKLCLLFCPVLLKKSRVGTFRAFWSPNFLYWWIGWMFHCYDVWKVAVEISFMIYLVNVFSPWEYLIFF